MLLDIVILPPAKLPEKLGKKMAEAIRGTSPVFFVDNKRLVPHMSLFHIRTSQARIIRLADQVKKVIENYRPVKIRCLGTELGGDYVGFRLTNNRALKKLNADMVERCYKLRTGVMPWTLECKQTAREKGNRKKYGTQHNIGPAFSPHFTSAKLKRDEDAVMIAERLKNVRFAFGGDTVAICEVNFWHQVKKILKIFKLKSKICNQKFDDQSRH